MKPKSLLIPLVLCLALIAIALSCNSSTPAPRLLIDKQVTVPGGGNTAEVVFNAKQGQRIRIDLQASSSDLQPYGYLTFPDGNGDYIPNLENTRDGKNSAEFALPQAGAYTLAIMDGSNQGGPVAVKVEIIN